MAFSIDNYRELSELTMYQDKALGLMRWGMNNAFPQTLKNLVAQSPTAKPAVERTARFIKGAGFEGEDLIIHPSGLTLRDIVSILAEDEALFGGFSMQLNYNLEGLVSSILPLSLTDLRFNQLDELNYASQIGYHPNFGLNSTIKKTITNTPTRGKIRWINRFNPESVLDEIGQCGGIKKYGGQVLYKSNAGYSMYPESPLLSAINYVLSDVENSVLVRKETTTGFVGNYLLKTTLDSEDPTLTALESALAEAQGAHGHGKVVTFSGLSEEEVKSTLLEEIGSGSSGRKTTIEACKTAYDLNKEVILGAYLIPPILGGVAQNTGFNLQALSDAYDIFNAITQVNRDNIEGALNRVIKNSVFSDKVGEIKIKTLKIDSNV